MDFNLTRTQEILSRTPRVLRALLEGLSEEWTRPNEGPETFSAFDNLAHLAHLERTSWIQRGQVILEYGSARPFPPVDRLGHEEEKADSTLAELLDEFADLRGQNLATLEGWGLSQEQLSLEGEHPAFGRVSLRQLLAAWTAHDLSHLGQISRVVSKQYRDAVGPWRTYLPILDR